MFDDDDLEQQAREGRKAFVRALREQNAQRQGELQHDIARREAFSGPEDWRQRREQPPREPEVAVARRSSLTDAELEQRIDERISQGIAQERAERERRIEAAFDALDAQVATAIEGISDAIRERMIIDLANARAARDVAIEAAEARVDVKLAELRVMVASEGAQIIEPARPRRTN
jgi:hypothetical protein